MKTAAESAAVDCKQRFLIQAEIYFNVDRYRDWLAVLHGRLEFPLPHGFDGLLVQAQAQTAGNANVARLAIGTDDQIENAGSLILRFAGFFGILGLWSI